MSLIPSETTEQTQSAEATPAVTDTQSAAIEQQANTDTETKTLKFLYDEGIEAEGEVPEWFKASKYKTIAEQAKGYAALEKRLGSFTGAPKDGKYEIKGIDLETSPLMKLTAEWGIENQLSPEGLESLVVKVRDLAQKQIEEDSAMAKKELGADADKRLAALAQWGRNNLAPEEFTQFQGLAQNAGQVKVLEKLIGMSKNSKLAEIDNVQSTKTDAKEELIKMQVATNEKGQRLMDVDMAYRAKVNAKMKQFYGE